MEKQEAYQILSDLVYKGFLVISLKIAEELFVFKTINEKEYDLIKLYTGDPEEESYTHRFNLNFLIFSLFSINGKNTLYNREKEFNSIFSFFSNMPGALRNKILSELNALRTTEYESVQFLEGFNYTDQSRNRWKIIKNNFPNREEFTGIPGTNKIGLNVYQENWMLLNKMLDEEERYNQNFSLAILVASASNPKGARNIRARHDASIQRVDDRRKKVAREGSIKRIQWSSKGWAAPVDTAEELVEELMRQMAGKKDRHDLFVEDHIKKIREEAEKQAKQAEEKIKELRKKREEEGLGATVTGTHRILTPEEMKNLMSKKSNNLMIVGSDEVVTKEEEKRYFNKIGSKVLAARK